MENGGFNSASGRSCPGAAASRSFADEWPIPTAGRDVARSSSRASWARSRCMPRLLWLTWPLAAHLGTHVACPNVGCDFDLLIAYWAQAWQVHALATDPARILEAPVFHPATHALFFMVLGLGSLPLFAPVYLATGNP